MFPMMNNGPSTPVLGADESRSDYVQINDSTDFQQTPKCRQRMEGEKTPQFTKIFNEHSDDDVNEMILKACKPHQNPNASFQEILNGIKARRYYLQQFHRIQEQTQMHQFFLWFSPEYEKDYCTYMQHHSIKRTRYVFFIGLICILGYFSYEAINGQYDEPHVDKEAIYILGYAISLPTVLFGILCTTILKKWAKKYIENITWICFLIVGMCLIIKKPLQEKRGPILPLFVLIIPIFGITRMRFYKASMLGWILVLSYIAVQLIFGRDLSSGESSSDIIFQGVNYVISVVGGMISHFRQELLRRRNYALGLPFAGHAEDEVHQELQTEKFSKHKLLHTWSRSFRDSRVEHCFYRYWYLIDPFPYEHPNAGILHQGVFRVVRFAVMGLALNQAVLGIQDYRFLRDREDEHIVSLVLRYGLVVPAYLSTGLFMYFLGRSFYNNWVNKEKKLEAECLRRTQMPESERNTTIDITILEPSMEKKLRQSDSTDDSDNSIQGNDNFTFLYCKFGKGGYVRYAQIYSSIVVGLHCAAMGGLLLTVSSSADPQPVYYMGLLNAILFAHRSGFRVRFIYATHSTLLVVLIFLIVTWRLQEDNFAEFGSYSVVVLVQAMMISYEEESLRRTFFVLKSIRLLEFHEWFGTVLKIQGWVKEKLQRRVAMAKGKVRGQSEDEIMKSYEQSQTVTNTSAQMASASKIGVRTQAANVLLGAISELA